jgi:hypothetical protein
MYYESQESSSTMNPKNRPADTSNAHFRLFPATSASARGRESPAMRNGRFPAVRVSRARKSRVSLENSFGIPQFCALSLLLPHLHVWGLPHLPSPCSHRGITGFSLRGSSLDHTTSFSLGILANRPCAHENRPIEIPCHQCTLLELPADHGISSPWRTDM